MMILHFYEALLYRKVILAASVTAEKRKLSVDYQRTIYLLLMS